MLEIHKNIKIHREGVLSSIFGLKSPEKLRSDGLRNRSPGTHDGCRFGKGNGIHMQIRTETAEDYREVFEVNYLAFGNREDESQLIEKIRKSEGFIPELSIVAVEEGKIKGHILLSKAIVEGERRKYDVIVLAPIAVHPDAQGRGIGGSLIEEGKQRCRELGYSVILLIGHPSYYPQFGFKPARTYALELLQFPVPDEVFQVCGLTEGALDEIEGELIYPEVFL